IEQIRGQAAPECFRFAVENRRAGFEIGRLDIRDEAPLEAGDHAAFEFGDLRHRTVAGEDNLLLRLEQVVEGVEEFLLNALLAAEKVDVVDEKNIGVAVALTELGEGVFLNGRDVDRKSTRLNS